MGQGVAPAFGDDLANLADDLHSQAGQFWSRRNSTTAVSEVNGQIYISSFGDVRATQSLESYASQNGYIFVPNNGDHAEVALYKRLINEPGFKGIGVSHHTGPCPDICQPFFNKVGFENVFWTGDFTP